MLTPECFEFYRIGRKRAVHYRPRGWEPSANDPPHFSPGFAGVSDARRDVADFVADVAALMEARPGWRPAWYATATVTAQTNT